MHNKLELIDHLIWCTEMFHHSVLAPQYWCPAESLSRKLEIIPVKINYIYKGLTQLFQPKPDQQV